MGKKYYVVSEKPTSQVYFIGGAIMQKKLNDDFTNGYVYGGSKITSEKQAVNTLRFLREVTELDFYMQDGVGYLRASGFVYIGEDNMPEIGENSIFTIQPNGFARYYSIGETPHGKEMTVDIPEHAAVYDETGICINFTTVTKNNITVLPPNGNVVFIGNAGDTLILQ